MLILLNTLSSIRIGSFMTSETIPETAKVSMYPSYAFKWGTLSDNAYVSIQRNGGFYVAGNTSNSAAPYFYSADAFYSNRQWNANAVASYLDAAILKYSTTLQSNVKIGKYNVNYLFTGRAPTALMINFVNMHIFFIGGSSQTFKIEAHTDNFFFSPKSEYTVTDPAFKIEAA